MIMFNPDESKCKLNESIVLPRHNEYIENLDNKDCETRDDFYDLEKGSLDKMTLKQIESITNERESDNQKVRGLEISL